MAKPLVLLSAMIAAVLMALTLVWFCGASYTPDIRSDSGKSDIIVFYPPASQPESVIFRHPHADGSADDDVQMRDGSTKHIIYDQKMLLRRVFAYFQGKDGQTGPLMYEKVHDASGHLWSEKHLRLDGSLEMAGHERQDGDYDRQYFYAPSRDTVAGPIQSAAVQNEPAELKGRNDLVVSSDRLFNHQWSPLSQTDYRADRSQSIVHLWDGKGSETVLAYAADGKTELSSEKTSSDQYAITVYLPDGVGLAYSLTNSSEGTTIQYYPDGKRQGLTVLFDSDEEDNFTLRDDSGRALFTQVWSYDYSAKAVDGTYPRVLDHIDHYDAFGRRDMRYNISPDGKLLSVIVLLDKEIYEAREIYTLDAEGWATKVEKYSDYSTTDGGKALTRDSSKHFALEPWMLVHPTYQLPKLKDGLRLYGVRPQRGPE